METQQIETGNQIRKKGVTTWILQMIFATVVIGILLFLAAGRLNWIGGWAFIGLNLFTQLLSAAILIPRQPELLAERSQIQKGTKGWDRFFAPAIMFFGTLATILTAGLDARFGWSKPVNAGLWWGALGIAFASQVFVLWAMDSNPFFATTVRIQDDRGHQVANSGPYKIVRHPGYAGSVIYTSVISLVLGSLWTFIPSFLTIALLLVRTWLEDNTLQAELPGYRDYTTQTPHRLFPGIW